MAETNPNRQPGDLILDRYMPQATPEEREAARTNLRTLLSTLIRIEERHALDDSGQLGSPKNEEHDRVINETNSPET